MKRIGRIAPDRQNLLKPAFGENFAAGSGITFSLHRRRAGRFIHFGGTDRIPLARPDQVHRPASDVLVVLRIRAHSPSAKWSPIFSAENMGFSVTRCLRDAAELRQLAESSNAAGPGSVIDVTAGDISKLDLRVGENL